IYINPTTTRSTLFPYTTLFRSTKEEMKMQNEGRRIMHLPEFRASVTCVRVPVYRAHSVAISAEFERLVSVEQAHEVLAKAPGLIDRKSTRLNSSHRTISYAVFC